MTSSDTKMFSVIENTIKKCKIYPPFRIRKTELPLIHIH